MGIFMKIFRIILFTGIIFLVAMPASFALFSYKQGFLNPENIILIGLVLILFGLWGMNRFGRP